MKNIIKLLGLLTIVATLFSCDEENHFQEPDFQLTPVYTVTNITGQNNLFSINIYREKSLIIEYSSDVNANNFTSTNYADTSTDTDYNISVSRIVDGVTTTYIVTGSKETGEGTIEIMDDATATYNIIIAETEVYN